MSTQPQLIQTEVESLKNEQFVAEFLQVSLGTVRRWRYEGRGPKYRKIGRNLVRYALSDLHDFLDSQAAFGAGVEPPHKTARRDKSSVELRAR